MLRQLPDARASELRDMLKELESMGIPKDPEFVPDANVAARHAEEDTQDAFSHLIRRINQAEADDIAFVLEAEPDCFIAAVMAAQTWAWRERVLAGLARERRERISALIRKYTERLPHRLKSSVLSVLGKRLDAPKVSGDGEKRKTAILSRLRAALGRNTVRGRT